MKPCTCYCIVIAYTSNGEGEPSSFTVVSGVTDESSGLIRGLLYVSLQHLEVLLLTLLLLSLPQLPSCSPGHNQLFLMGKLFHTQSPAI